MKSKEREAVLSFQQIKEKEDIREDSVQEEIMKLVEKSKKLNEKLTIAGKEIVVLKEELEIEKETNITNSKKLQEKIDVIENSLVDLGLKFRDSDQLNKVSCCCCSSISFFSLVSDTSLLLVSWSSKFVAVATS